MEKLRKTLTVSGGSRSRSWDLKPGPSEYESWVLTTRQPCLVCWIRSKRAEKGQSSDWKEGI